YWRWLWPSWFRRLCWLRLRALRCRSASALGRIMAPTTATRMVRRSAHMGTTHTIRTPARRTVTTGRSGSEAASSSVPVRGIARAIGAAITDVATIHAAILTEVAAGMWVGAMLAETEDT